MPTKGQPFLLTPATANAAAILPSIPAHPDHSNLRAVLDNFGGPRSHEGSSTTQKERLQ